MGKLRRRLRRGVSRRDFLRRAGWAAAGAAAVPLLPACGGSGGGPAPLAAAADSVFRCGVASGDPLTDRVILWTHVTPPSAGAVIATGTVTVYEDEALARPLASRAFATDAARDFTVKVDFDGLAPGRTYWYRFSAFGASSRPGRTRTAPTGAIPRVRFGVVSCSSYAHGFFNAYAQLARRTDIDAILHLGDYLYEYGTAEYGERRPYEPPHEMVTLADYRTRHAYYKREPDLQELHRLFPFVTVWDDHESTDNSWRDGAVNHTEGAEGRWVDRKAIAQQAYDEWMPIRYPQAGDRTRIWRSFRYGDLAEVFMLDTRLYDRDAPDGLPATATGKQPGRRLLGPEQMQWLKQSLAASTAQWKVIGSQVVMHSWNVAPLPQAAGGGQQLNGDAWDGYQAERTELLSHLRDQGIGNVIVLSGDVHSSWVADLALDPGNPAAYNPATGAGALAAEFTVPSITSPFAIDIPEGQQAFQALNPHIRYIDFDRKGYLVLDVDPQRARGDYWYISGIDAPGGTESFGVGYEVQTGANRLDLLPASSS